MQWCGSTWWLEAYAGVCQTNFLFLQVEVGMAMYTKYFLNHKKPSTRVRVVPSLGNFCVFWNTCKVMSNACHGNVDLCLYLVAITSLKKTIIDKLVSSHVASCRARSHTSAILCQRSWLASALATIWGFTMSNRILQRYREKAHVHPYHADIARNVSAIYVSLLVGFKNVHS